MKPSDVYKCILLMPQREQVNNDAPVKLKIVKQRASSKTISVQPWLLMTEQQRTIVQREK